MLSRANVAIRLSLINHLLFMQVLFLYPVRVFRYDAMYRSKLVK